MIVVEQLEPGKVSKNLQANMKLRRRIRFLLRITKKRWFARCKLVNSAHALSSAHALCLGYVCSSFNIFLLYIFFPRIVNRFVQENADCEID